jgi:hypothetical protein
MVAGAEGGANSAGFGYISAFDSDGYSWTAGSTSTGNFNKSSQTLCKLELVRC